MFNYNEDQDRRNEILSKYLKNKINYDVVYFKEVPLDVMQKLSNENFLDPNDKQNDAPTASEFIEFAEKYPFVKFHGYIVSKDRKDYRTTIEGLEAPSYDKKKYPDFVKDFIAFNRLADDLEYDNKFYSWFD
jgi:hypothetical protein